ncbi:uncharacterized protein LOC116304092 [Actinia tenebrosa]|uniref:Uncharacterized protein LOC116304092 n=1 Tax=Actinia tenebrosa TaxID=6105 RepID=A0A6P8ITT5_ACTTE|nr:uncharacterized protein LOC116304092 [Actinia tenebrosa]
MSKRRVVLAIDNSSCSKEAFDFYCNNLHRPDDILLIIHSFELPSMPAVPYPYGYSYYEDWRSIVQQADEEAVASLENYGRKCQHKKIEFKLFKEGGKAGEVICKFAKDEKANMIVMGSRGLGTIRRTFLGSVSDYCLHHSAIPVVVVPPHEEHAKAQGKKE